MYISYTSLEGSVVLIAAMQSSVCCVKLILWGTLYQMLLYKSQWDLLNIPD